MIAIGRLKTNQMEKHMIIDPIIVLKITAIAVVTFAAGLFSGLKIPSFVLPKRKQRGKRRVTKRKTTRAKKPAAVEGAAPRKRGRPKLVPQKPKFPELPASLDRRGELPTSPDVA